MREDPIEDEPVSLVVTARSPDSTDVESLAATIEDVGGSVEDRLQFGALRVDIKQEDVEDLCSLDGIESIETNHAIGYGGDSGEDVGSN